jgi:hypothetical protein
MNTPQRATITGRVYRDRDQTAPFAGLDLVLLRVGKQGHTRLDRDTTDARGDFQLIGGLIGEMVGVVAETKPEDFLFQVTLSQQPVEKIRADFILPSKTESEADLKPSTTDRAPWTTVSDAFCTATDLGR